MKRNKRVLIIISLCTILLIVIVIKMLPADEDELNISDFVSKGERDRAPATRTVNDRDPNNVRVLSVTNNEKVDLIKESPFLKRSTIHHEKSPEFASDFKVDVEEKFEVDGNEYHLVKSVFAVPKNLFDGRGEVVGEKLGHILIKSDLAPINSVRMVQKSNGKVAIFTGVLKLKLFNFDEIYKLDIPGNFEIQESYPHLNWALIQFSTYEETMESFEYLKNHPAIEMVDIELLQYERSGN